MINFLSYLLTWICLLTSTLSSGSPLKIGLGQFHDMGSFEANRDKILSMMDKAAENACDLVVFHEYALVDPALLATKAQYDEAIEQIKAKAADLSLFVICGVNYRESDIPVKHKSRNLIINASGMQESFYRKNIEIPKPFYINDIPCHSLICADRWFLEMADLFCLVKGSKIIIDVSGGHGGDDGRPDLRWIRYRSWAQRTNAFVIIVNPPHRNTADFMGNKPWGGHSAVINPDGTFYAQTSFQDDTLVIASIDPDHATLAMAKERRNNTVFKSFWDFGENILEGDVQKMEPFKVYTSNLTSVKVAAVQMVCSRAISENVTSILRYIKEAAQNGADLVVFPELAVTGPIREDIEKATHKELNKALIRIQKPAKKYQITVVFGMPFLNDSKSRKNSAWVVGPEGKILTRYDQIALNDKSLFKPGNIAKSMWFKVKGVYSTLSIGKDADYPEITILAGAKGTQMHFHISCEINHNNDYEIIRRQKGLNLIAPARFGAIVNTGKSVNSGTDNLFAGGSMIGIRVGGHNIPDPGGIETYLPYTSSILTSAGSGQEILYGTYTATRTNNTLSWLNSVRKNSRPEWFEWIKKGVNIISNNL